MKCLTKSRNHSVYVECPFLAAAYVARGGHDVLAGWTFRTAADSFRGTTGTRGTTAAGWRRMTGVARLETFPILTLSPCFSGAAVQFGNVWKTAALWKTVEIIGLKIRVGGLTIITAGLAVCGLTALALALAGALGDRTAAIYRELGLF